MRLIGKPVAVAMPTAFQGCAFTYAQAPRIFILRSPCYLLCAGAHKKQETGEWYGGRHIAGDSDTIEQRHEAVVHVNLHVAVK